MTISESLAAPYRYIYEKILQPRASEPLEWREVRALFHQIGDVGWEANGDFRVIRNGHILILRPAPSKDVSGADELLELQRFLERSEQIPPLLDPAEPERQDPGLVRTPLSGMESYEPFARVAKR
jgi:hypothetical protein